MANIQYATTDWDFKTANTKQDTHIYHNYPAMMIPQIASRLITHFASGAKTLLDPYCGTGTSLVEANLQGINAIGCDLNPMARLIAKTKTSPIKLPTLQRYLKAFDKFLHAPNTQTHNITMPNFKNIDFWFKKDTKKQLAYIKHFIQTIADKTIQQFFLVAFSETVRDASLTRNSEFKLYRIPEKQRATFNPNVFELMNKKLTRNSVGLQSFIEKIKNNPAQSCIYNINTSQNTHPIHTQSIDIVVTSPPYGDSKTTVAYGQFSRLSNQWLGVENANQIDKKLMGGQTKPIQTTGVEIIDQTVEKIAKVDEKRAQEVYSFYADYQQSITHVAQLIKPNGHACYVVGNRCVKNALLPTDEITKTLFEHKGFIHKHTFIRNIPHKKMPKQNSPTNKIGKKASTMNHEYIVVMQKQ